MYLKLLVEKKYLATQKYCKLWFLLVDECRLIWVIKIKLQVPLEKMLMLLI